MLIDAYAEEVFTELAMRAEALAPGNHLYLLVDGAFVPGLHRKLPTHAKALLFESLPGSSEAARDVSPFLTPFDPVEKTLQLVIKHCSKWPMLSVIETPELIGPLAERLSAWCVVEADGQRFNFRFSDTRRLRAIVETLTAKQRAQFAGPATRWSYVSRDGRWHHMELAPVSEEAVAEPVLDQIQFARLVDDSRGDELMSLLSDRGDEVYRKPSRSHALITAAIGAADKAGLGSGELIRWCQWFWQRDQLCDDGEAASVLNTWLTEAR